MAMKADKKIMKLIPLNIKHAIRMVMILAALVSAS
jgi:hypothetical protein